MNPLKPVQGHGLVFLDPPRLEDWAVSALKNRENLMTRSFIGLSVKDMRSELEIPTHQAVFLSGHQPVLLHPGLYAKLMAASTAASRRGGLVFHKITDTDVPREWKFRYPTADEIEAVNPFFEPGFLDIPYADLPAPSRERVTGILDRCEASGLPAVREGCRDAKPELLNLAGEMDDWNQFHFEVTDGLDHRLGHSRTYIRASSLFGTRPFLRYVVAWLTHLDILGDRTNRAIERYRHDFNVHNEADPTPNLRTEGSWREAPFWLAEKNRPRTSLWVKRTGTSEALLKSGTDGPTWNGMWPDGILTIDGPVRIWPKVLPQSLFARLFLCDYFVHGLGGGRYERANDLFLQEDFNGDPPAYGVASATFYIDPDSRLEAQEEMERLNKALSWERTFEQNPEYALIRADRWAQELPDPCIQAIQAIVDRAEFRNAVEEKMRLLEGLKNPERRQEAGRRVREVNEMMKGLLSSRREVFDRLNGERRSVSLKWESLSWREYPYFCYPLAILKGLKSRMDAS